MTICRETQKNDPVKEQEKRVFIAVKPEIETTQALQALQSQWAQSLDLPPNTFVPKENLHLTMHFLSRIPEFKLEVLMEKMHRHTSLKSFHFTFNRFVAFPNTEKARVLALAGQPGNSPLSHLFYRIGEDIAGLNLWLEERLFLPHISLFRLKKEGLSKDAPTVSPLKTLIKTIALYESVLSPTGSHYTVLKEWDLS